MTVYSRQIERAQCMIDQKGQSVTWRQIVDTPNPTEPWKPTAGTPVDNTVKIVFFPYSLQTKKTLQFLTGTEIKSGYIYGLMASVSFTPGIKDVVIRGSKQLIIDSIDVLDPDGTPILYTIGFQE